MQNTFSPSPWQTQALQMPSAFALRNEYLTLLTHSPRRLLDIGCGSGGLGYRVRKDFAHCQTVGLDINAKAIDLARANYDQTFVMDASQLSLQALNHKENERFDTICLLNVLECAIDPWAVMHQLLPLCTPDVQILVSIANVSNVLLLSDAFRGFWRYREHGLLSAQTLRFFTDFDAQRLFYQAGFRVLAHRYDQTGLGLDVFQKFKDQPFPLSLQVGEMSLKVQNCEDLARLTAQQNVYLLSLVHPEHPLSEAEQILQSTQSSTYPLTDAWGSGAG